MELNETEDKKEAPQLSRLYELAVLLIWIAILAVSIWKRDAFTMDGILRLTPDSFWPAFGVCMCLFAAKSVSIVIYSGFLYAAIGLLFPLPQALATALCGSAIMFAIPYYIGKLLGTRAINAITAKYPKTELLRALLGKNEILSSALVRMIGVISYDAESIVLGASGMRFWPYMAGSMLGFFPFMLILTFVGQTAQKPGTPGFWLSIAATVLHTVIPAVICVILWKHFQKSAARESKK